MDAFRCSAIPIHLEKDVVLDTDGNKTYRCGFRFIGGIDQRQRDGRTCIEITHVDTNSAAERAGLKVADQVLEVNGYDFTLLTHKKATKYMDKDAVLKMLVTRDGISGTAVQ